MNGLSKRQWSGPTLGLALKAVLVVMGIFLFYPPASFAQGPTAPTDARIKPIGSAESNVSLWIPKGSVSESFLATADYIAKKDLPKGVAYPANSAGQAFMLGLWVGDGMTLRRFAPSIVVSVKYNDDDIPAPALEDEDRLHLVMYNPTTKSWVKLCSSVDIHENFVAAALSFPAPLDGKGSSLMALAIDNTPPLTQVVDKQGTTTISLKGSNLGFRVLLETVEVGSHFEITILPNVVQSGAVKLFSRPVDIKGCRMDYSNPTENNRELISYPKPLRLSFNYDSDTLSRAGGKTGLTIVNLQNGQWVDEESLGSRVERGDDVIIVDTTSLGTFGMAAR